MKNKQGKILRTIGIVFMGLTAAMNILGGIGTVCAAFLTKNFPPMQVFIEYQLLYQVIMILTIIIGIICIWSMMSLLRGGMGAHRNAISLLTAGTMVAAAQFVASLIIRGKAVPANMKFFTNLITLIIFLIYWMPSIRQKVDFEKSGGGTDKPTAAGLASILAGSVVLTAAIWAGPSHTYLGHNWVTVLDNFLSVAGAILVLGGLTALVWTMLDALAAGRRRMAVEITDEDGVA